MNIDEYAAEKIRRDDTRIRNEKSAAQIALLLHRYRTVSWSPANIKSHVTLSDDDLRDGIEWMKRKRYISGRTMVFLTDSGVEFVEGLKRNVSVSSAASEARFKTEALSGMVEVKSVHSGFMISEQSGITAAALPSLTKPQTKTTPEDMMIEREKTMKSKAWLARSLNLEPEVLEAHIESGRVHYCRSCDSIQIFNRKTFNRWHSVCRKCQKVK